MILGMQGNQQTKNDARIRVKTKGKQQKYDEPIQPIGP